MKLLLGTKNRGKVRELLAILNDNDLPDVELLTVDDRPFSDVPETGGSFLENARLKARTIAEETGLPVLAEDSGLEVEALGGAPPNASTSSPESSARTGRPVSSAIVRALRRAFSRKLPPVSGTSENGRSSTVSNSTSGRSLSLRMARSSRTLPRFLVPRRSFMGHERASRRSIMAVTPWSFSSRAKWQAAKWPVPVTSTSSGVWVRQTSQPFLL